MEEHAMSPRLRILILSFVALMLIGTVYAADDWPGFRGPNYDGTATSPSFSPSADTNLIVSWRAKAGSGYSGISIVEGKAVTAFTDQKDDVVVAYDSKTGKQLWRFVLSPVYKGHDGSHDGPIATPTISGGKVIALSTYGDLTGIDLNTGKKLWTVNVTKEGGRKPFYGYTASPIVANGSVVLQMGGEKGKAIAAFDPQTGKMKWSLGDDMVNYQSPILMDISGKKMVVALTDKKVFLIDPATGKSVHEYDHGGDDAAGIDVPVPLDENRLLLRNKQDSADLIRFVTASDGKVSVEKVWSAGIFKNSYNPPVYYKNHLYGYNGRILTCVDAANGQTKWRSRDVRDGFLLLVNGHLVVQTKDGSLHVGPASPEGFKEAKRVDVFKEISWTPPSYADGAIFTRSHGEIARVELSSGAQTASITGGSPALVTGSKFGSFLKHIEAASDKKALVDKFIAENKTSPIVEWPDQVIFFYRGPGEDIAIMGDLQPQREDPMTRIPGTDLFYYVGRLEPDARINYRYVRNFEENIADPQNPREEKDRRGNPISWFAMPGWQEPTHIQEPPESKRGKFESHEIKSKTNPNGLAKLDVYLPAGYEQSTELHPVLYLLDAQSTRAQGALHHSLENLRGKSFQPAILVYLTEIKTASEDQRISVLDQVKQTSKYFVEEIVPFIDSKYRTMKDRQGRALAGFLTGGGTAIYTAFENSQVFGGVATQSMWPMDVEAALKQLVTKPEEKPMRIYMDWGLYDARSREGGFDLREANRNVYAFLTEKGYRPAGGETHDGYGWQSWRNRNDRVLSALFAK